MPPSRSLGYYLETVHWLDAITPPLQDHLGTLTEQVKQLLGDHSRRAPGLTETASAGDDPANQPASPKRTNEPDGVMAARSKNSGSLIKFNLAFVPILNTGVCAIAFVTRNQLRDNAQQEVLESARLMLETIRASRTYTDQQITPLLERQQKQIDKSAQVARKALETTEKVADAGKRQALLNVLNQVGINNESTQLPQGEFHPQSIPFFAATEAFNYFRKSHPDYAYKEAALNPTNLRDRTVDWEADVVFFAKIPPKQNLSGTEKRRADHPCL